MIPFYTEEEGTSMATPFTAGAAALMLDADPTLSPDDIKQIMTDTATAMPGYQDYEVGAGYINAYAAVDKAYNRARVIRTFRIRRSTRSLAKSIRRYRISISILTRAFRVPVRQTRQFQVDQT